MENLLARVGEAFNSTFGVDPQTITINTVPSDIPAWDSLGHAVLTTSLEKIFDVAFDVDDLMAMETVKDICRIVQSKLARSEVCNSNELNFAGRLVQRLTAGTRPNCYSLVFRDGQFDCSKGALVASAFETTPFFGDLVQLKNVKMCAVLSRCTAYSAGIKLCGWWARSQPAPYRGSSTSSIF